MVTKLPFVAKSWVNFRACLVNLCVCVFVWRLVKILFKVAKYKSLLLMLYKATSYHI